MLRVTRRSVPPALVVVALIALLALAFSSRSATRASATVDPVVPGIIISEVSPWSSGNSPFQSDWFEVTNTSPVAVNITGWKMDDNSNGVPTSAEVPLSGITTIAAGESVIFTEVGGGQTAAGQIAGFKSTWFGANPPAGLQVGTYSGSGVGLSTGGDAVNLFSVNGTLQAHVDFGLSTTSAPFKSFDNAAGVNTVTSPPTATISNLSALGVNGAFSAACVGSFGQEIGSPGTIHAPSNPPPPCGALPPIRMNEIQSAGAAGTVNDWLELTNTGAVPVDVSGFVFEHGNNTATKYVIPGGTPFIAAGGFLVLTGASFHFDLGSVDSAQLFEPDGTTLIDSFAWGAQPVTSYGRCPDGAGTMMTTLAVTQGAANSCLSNLIAAQAWPGGAAVATADAGTNVFGQNLSGLTYEASGLTTPGVLWAVDNGPAKLYRLTWNGTIWTPDRSNGWATGKTLCYTPACTGDPDSEGVTMTSAGSAGGLYVSSERDNNNSNVSKLAVLRFDVSGAGAPLVATQQWDLTADLPVLGGIPGGSNLGLEAITWVPDSFLTAHGFYDERDGHTYAPGDYPLHGNGIFFVGVEANGLVYAFALNSDGSYARIATIITGFGTIMELSFDRDRGDLWAVCDNTCDGRTELLTVNPVTGRFGIAHLYERPAGMPNINNEGFVVSSDLECLAGLKPAFWSDDDNDGGIAVRRGTAPCVAKAPSVISMALGAVISASSANPQYRLVLANQLTSVQTYLAFNAPYGTQAACAALNSFKLLVALYSSPVSIASITGVTPAMATAWTATAVAIRTAIPCTPPM